MTDLARHYDRDGLSGRLLAGLAAAGVDVEHLEAADLAAVDEFHVRGREASAELFAAMGVAADMEVLDIGCGIGGPARHLAGTAGCRVTGIDLTRGYVEAAAVLTARCGMAERVAFRQGDATALSFPDSSFDAAFTIHVAMNVADKAAMYAEALRVLRPGGRFGVYDVLRGDGGAPRFPVPWAETPAGSFLASPDEMPGLLEGAGFVVEQAEDVTAAGRDWFAAMQARVARDGPPRVGLHLLMGPRFAEMAANMARNLAEGRVALGRFVGRRPG